MIKVPQPLPRVGLSSVAVNAACDVALPLTSGCLLAISASSPSVGLVAWAALIPFAAAIARQRGTVELYAGAYLGGVLYTLQCLEFMRTRISGAGLFQLPVLDWLACGLLWGTAWPATLLLARRLWKLSRFPMGVVLPIAWISGEWLRRESGWLVLWSPFPWAQLAATQSESRTFVQLADLGGVWAITALVAVTNGLLFDAASKRVPKPIAIAACILIAAVVYGRMRIHQQAMQEGPTVALAPAALKPAGVMNLPPSTDVVVWSEATAARFSNQPGGDSVEALEDCARINNASLVLGCTRKVDGAVFNSVAFVAPDRGYRGSYDKCFLVPWSEFSPWTWPRSADRSRRYALGATRPVVTCEEFTCAASICYDAAFDRHFRSFSPKPDFFVLCSCETSDPTGQLARLMLDMTRFRAIENRRAFVRNAEGGWSGIVDGNGDVTMAPPEPWSGAVSIGKVPIDRRFALASLVGDSIPLACIATIFIAIAGGLWKQSRARYQARPTPAPTSSASTTRC